MLSRYNNIVTDIVRHNMRHEDMCCIYEPALTSDLNDRLSPFLTTQQTAMLKIAEEWKDH